MISGIDDIKNLEKIAIIVVGYNRLHSISRLLNSLIDADYPPTSDIPLVISIDASGDTELYNYVKAFNWPHGPVYVNIQENRLGLKNHIYQCCDLSQYFKGIILLEDDLFVSPAFYSYATKAIEVYGENAEIAQISLYRNDSNGYVSFPFSPIRSNADVFLWQEVCTWGEAWTFSMWKRFVQWRDSICSESIIDNCDMPVQIKNWTRAWSKYYNAYVVANKKWVVYPYNSLTTNFSDAGEHGNSFGLVQVEMQQAPTNWIMPDIDTLCRYDLFANNLDIHKWLDLDEKQLCLDCYGHNRQLLDRRYLLSPRKYSYKIIKSFGAVMRPIDANILYNIDGNALFLYDTAEIPNSKCGKFSNEFLSFFFHNISTHHVWKYSLKTFAQAIKRKLHLC